MSSSVWRRPWRLDETDGDVGSPLVTANALIEHGVGLADTGRGAEVDAEMAGRLDVLRVFGRHGDGSVLRIGMALSAWHHSASRRYMGFQSTRR